MQVLDNNHLKCANFQFNTKPTGDLKDNFDKILLIAGQTLADQLGADNNLQAYPNPQDFPDAHIIGLSLLQEALSMDSEHCFWNKLQSDYAEAFPAFLLQYINEQNERPINHIKHALAA